MAKSKYPTELKIRVAKAYLSGEGSFRFLATKYGVGVRCVDGWSRKYREHGEDAFIKLSKNNTYSSSFKKACVEEVLSRKGSVDDVVAKYKISSRSVLQRWIKMYNANRELKDYCPNREVYMAESRRKTTIEERKEIVEYCIKHNRNYKETASFYDVSYSQVYTWVKKYDEKGDDGLIDKRGHHKLGDELSELELLRRENIRLKKKLEEQERIALLLKKAQEFERM